MREKHFYTEEEQTEIRSNPYTLYVTPYKVVFTLAFKKYVVAEHKKPGMTSRKIFLNAGYREGIFTNLMMQKRVKYILQEGSTIIMELSLQTFISNVVLLPQHFSFRLLLMAVR